MLPIFYNRLATACTADQQMEIVAQHLDAESAVLATFGEQWDECGRLPSRGPEWRYVALVLDDDALCVLAARERPGDPQTVEIRDLEVREAPPISQR